MKYILSIVLAALMCGPVCGQPSSAKKAARAVFTLKTFTADGTLKGSSAGFFVDNKGTALSCFSPLNGAARAVAIDASGKEAPVALVLGANDDYDLSRLAVDTRKAAPLPLAAAPVAAGSQLWLVAYGAKSPVRAVVRKVEKVTDGRSYYTLSLRAPQSAAGSPLLDDEGAVVAVLQQPQTDADTVCYAVDAAMAANLKISGLSINDPALRSTSIKKALPDERDQAVLTLYVAPNVLDSAAYATLVNDFITKFPAVADGYTTRANLEVEAGRFAEAAADMDQALKVADKKDDAHFSLAKLIFRKEVEQPGKAFAPWSLDKAAAEADAAYGINPLPVYRELKAQILYAQQKYADALSVYDALAKTNLRSAAVFYAASQCCAQLKDTLGMIARLDSCVATFDQPYLKEAGPYLYARARALDAAGRYRDAVPDYNEFEKLNPVGLQADFYYVREQCELRGRLFQQALNDINKAIELAPSEPVYVAEKALIEVRVGLLDDAVKTSQQAIRLAPESSDGYFFLGLAQCLKKEKTQGLANLKKARELGNTQAQEFIDKYSKPEK